MQLSILMMFVGQMFKLITPEVFVKFVDSGLTALETMVKNSTNTYDDATVIPLISMIRETLGIPDHADQSSVNNVVGATLDLKTQVIPNLLMMLFRMVPKDLVKTFMDEGFDKIQEIVIASTNKIDDTVVLPMISLMRVSFDIPENPRPHMNLPPGAQLLTPAQVAQLQAGQPIQAGPQPAPAS